jgi:Flp pilus assembly protein TadD
MTLRVLLAICVVAYICAALVRGQRDREALEATTTALRLLESGQAAGAATLLRRAVRLNPTLWSPHWVLGRALAMRGDFVGAAREYGDASRLGAGAGEWASTQPLCELADLLERAGRHGEALTYWRQAVAHGGIGPCVTEARSRLSGTRAR